MKKSIIICAICVCGVFGFADEISDALKNKLTTAIERGSSAEAQQWATALKDYKEGLIADEQLKAATTANKVLKVYDNLLTSAPAVIDGIIRYNKESPYGVTEPCEDIAMFRFMKVVATMIERPVTADDIDPVVDAFVENDKAVQQRFERHAK